jgi:hypothetical protein
MPEPMSVPAVWPCSPAPSAALPTSRNDFEAETSLPTRSKNGIPDLRLWAGIGHRHPVRSLKRDDSGENKIVWQKSSKGPIERRRLRIGLRCDLEGVCMPPVGAERSDQLPFAARARVGIRQSSRVVCLLSWSRWARQAPAELGGPDLKCPIPVDNPAGAHPAHPETGRKLPGRVSHRLAVASGGGDCPDFS